MRLEAHSLSVGLSEMCPIILSLNGPEQKENNHYVLEF